MTNTACRSCECRKGKTVSKPTVAFICTHNSCRSQMAEALAKLFAADTFNSYSAGTDLKDNINPDAVRCIKRLYNVDMEATGQYPKLIGAIPPPDIVVTMGCGVECPWLPAAHREDWGIDDPTGLSDAIFEKTAQVIEAKVHDLKNRIVAGKMQLSSRRLKG
jgi:arsenate reductase (thioredoxin)